MYYLMIKTHNKTGLKYLCKTEQSNYEKYPGSGKYWKRHLKEHGHDFRTELIYSSNDLEEFNIVCVEMSNLYNVVESDEWANLIIETGLDGTLGLNHTDETKEKIGEASKNRKRSPLSDLTKSKLSEALKGKPMQCSLKGHAKSETHRKNLSEALKGKSANFSEDGLERMRASVSKRQKIKYRCSICGKMGNAANIGRYHKQCMENETWQKIQLNDLQ